MTFLNLKKKTNKKQFFSVLQMYSAYDLILLLIESLKRKKIILRIYYYFCTP